MKALLENYSLSEIVVFVIFLAIAIKELVSIVDWTKMRISKIYDKSIKKENEKKEIKEEIEIVDSVVEKNEEKLRKMSELIDMLIESDKENIKAYITEKHHYFVYEKGWIDDYFSDCLEKRFAIYSKEHGNSFVEGLMNEIRDLPKQPPTEDEHKYVNTSEYVKKTNN